MSEYICPHCRNPIYDDEAILCLYCGESLKRNKKDFPYSKTIFVIILLILLFSFIFSIIK